MSSPVAVLVDGENIRADFAGQIYKAIEQLDPPRIRRVYMNAAIQNGWTNMHGWKVVHSGTGKNATDLLLSIEAVDMVLTQGITQVVIVSSDGDFSHLATYFRERGFTFIGIGEAKTAAKFRKACGQFITLHPPAPPSDPVQLHVPKPAPIPKPELSSTDQHIVEILRKDGDAHGWMDTAKLNVLMRRKEMGFRISTTASKTWRAYFTAKPNLYELMAQDNQIRVRALIDADHRTGT
ncbi:MAG: NYN domain-containing protein [Pseudomonadota bacterium]|nr:NYN domain-containing protein [Pseudomonadota bacterium]